MTINLSTCHRILNNRNCTQEEIAACGQWLIGQASQTDDNEEKFRYMLGLARLVSEKNYCFSNGDSCAKAYRWLKGARDHIKFHEISHPRASQAHYKIAIADLIAKIPSFKDLSDIERNDLICEKYGQARAISGTTRASCYKLALFLQNNPAYFPKHLRDNETRAAEKLQLISDLFNECVVEREGESESHSSGENDREIGLIHISRTALLSQLDRQGNPRLRVRIGEASGWRELQTRNNTHTMWFTQ